MKISLFHGATVINRYIGNAFSGVLLVTITSMVIWNSMITFLSHIQEAILAQQYVILNTLTAQIVTKCCGSVSRMAVVAQWRSRLILNHMFDVKSISFKMSHHLSTYRKWSLSIKAYILILSVPCPTTACLPLRCIHGRHLILSI